MKPLIILCFTFLIHSTLNAAPPNIVLVFIDDMGWGDFSCFGNQDAKTPQIDRLAKEGVRFEQFYVNSPICSPSRTAISTGQYPQRWRITSYLAHRALNERRGMSQWLDPKAPMLARSLQQAGYATGHFGKWHMGNHSDAPQPGFDHWESFRGQGVYYGPTLNINGTQISYDESTYISDILTEHAVEWLENADKEKPFFMYLSHKAVHSEFAPAQRHMGTYETEEISYPPSFDPPPRSQNGSPSLERNGQPPRGKDHYGDRRLPDWVKEQRESWHGVDYMYHGGINFEDFFHRYTETLRGIDDSVGSVLGYLDRNGLAEDTLVIYMGDNGFSFGEHGLIDKRHFYEESAKVPLIVRWPSKLEGGEPIESLVQNIDIAPTILEAAGIQAPQEMQGMSFVPLMTRADPPWRDRIFYEYFWELDFPQTPTMFGVRTDRYKYIRYHGIWDTNEFYDLENDPNEMQNLIDAPEHQERITSFANDIYDWLEETNGLNIPLKKIVRPKFGDHRNQDVL